MKMFRKKEEEEKIVFQVTQQPDTTKVSETQADEVKAASVGEENTETENAQAEDKAFATEELQTSVSEDGNEKQEPSAFVKKGKKEKKKEKKKKKKGKWIVPFIILLVVVFGVIYSLSQKGKSAPIPVVLGDVITGDITQTVDASGTVASEESKIYFSKVSAPITGLSVKEGQDVKMGDVLVSFDTKAIEDSISQAELENQITKTGADVTIVGINDAQKKAAEAAKNYDEAVLYVAHYQECVNQFSAQLEKADELSQQQAAAQAELAEYNSVLQMDPENADAKKGAKEKKKKIASLEKQIEAMDVKTLRKNYEMCAGDLEAYKALKSQYEAQKEQNPTAGLQKEQQNLMKKSADFSKQLAQEKLIEAQKGVVAEFDGIVSRVAVVEGQTAVEGAELFEVCNANKIKVTIDVSKYDIEKVAVGQNAVVTINGNDYKGEIANISRIASVNQTGGVVVKTEVHILNPDERIVLGIEGKVKINTATEKDAILVPSSCVNYASDGVFCFVVEDGKVKKVDVVTGLADDEHIQILSGLKAGDRVIKDVSAEIQEGVEVMEMPDLMQMGDSSTENEGE